MTKKNSLRPLPYSLSERHKIPEEPGVYILYNDQEEILYIGKAKNLKKRVASYFRKEIKASHNATKTVVMMTQVESLSVITTATEQEALILENQLIKTNQPKYNILLKDDKTYPYIKITTQEPFPRVLIVREKRPDKAQYFGPFPSIGSTRSLQNVLLSLVPIRDCSQRITLNKKQPKCINLDIGRCIGPCINKETKADYEGYIQQLIDILKGKDKKVLQELNVTMSDYAEKKEYEKAAVIRDSIQKLTQLMTKQRVHINTEKTLQVWAYQTKNNIAYLCIQTFTSGKLLSQNGVYQEDKASIEGSHFFQTAFFNQVTDSDESPDELICDQNVAALLTSQLGPIIKEKKISITVPQKGQKKDLLTQAMKQAKLALLRLSQTPVSDTKPSVTEQIRHILDLEREPRVICGFDISHLQGSNIVASAVCFVDGKPSKEHYRHFKIRSMEKKSNDPKALYEAVKRRLTLSKEKGELQPDLLVIDGGKGQLNFAIRAVEELGLEQEVYVIALAKREEEIHQRGYPIRPCKSHPCLRLIQYVRDESHRFSGRLQKKQRGYSHESMILSQIPGLGKTRINLIYQTFGSIDQISNKDLDKLAQLGKMGRTMAEKILQKIGKVDL